MKRKIISLIMVILLTISSLTVLIQIQPVKGESQTWTVDDNGSADFHTIQEAVDAAIDGDTILVYPGTYIENVWVRKSLDIKSVMGAEATIVRPASPDDWTAIFRLDHTTNANITGFTVEENVNGHGIVLNAVTGCRITKNRILNNIYGIILQRADGNFISDNELHQNDWYAVLLTGSSYNVIHENKITMNTAVSIALYQSNQNEITGNEISNNDAGIYLWDTCSSNTVLKNFISSCYSAIRLMDQSSDNNITQNTLTDNAWGLGLENSDNNIIYLNNFINCGGNSDSSNLWNSPDPITYTYNFQSYTSFLGNYWRDYFGSDTNPEDGIGDTPYYIDGETDNYPLKAPYENYVTPSENQPPVALFIYSPVKPIVGETISFDASSSYDPDGFIWEYTGYYWDFGDGSPMMYGKNAFHTYWATGDYIVKLTVWDNLGLSDSERLLIRVTPEWRIDIQIGDILLHNDGGILDFALDWTHAGIYVGDDKVVEALLPRVSKTEITTWDDDKRLVLLRVKTATEQQKQQAAQWAEGQIGKKFNPDWWEKKTEANSPSWYCSELVWASYKNQDIDIDYDESLIFVSPDDIYKDDDTEEIARYLEDLPPKEHGFMIKSDSPIDLLIEDPDGLILHKEFLEIPNSYYLEGDIDYDGEIEDLILISQEKVGDYLITIIPEQDALPTETYTLEFMREDMQIVLAKGVHISDIFEQPYIIRSTETEIIPIIPATINFDPDTLNLKSEGKVVTVYIELPLGHGYSVNDIDYGTIMLNGQIYAEAKPFEFGDYDSDGIPDLMVKFDRSLVSDILEVGETVTITISGELLNGQRFEGTDIICVISPGKK